MTPIYLSNYLASYQNTAEINDRVFTEFTANTDQIDYLKAHRDFVEMNKLGFGDRAFHFMWYLILKSLGAEKKQVDALEIGVFKGQVISLWALISKNESLEVNLSGITPLEGNPSYKNKLLNKIFSIFSAKYREDKAAGNFYDDVNYLTLIQSLFTRFNLDFGKVSLHKGYSNAPEILERTKDSMYDLIYVDGDHSYNGALFDLQHYGPKIRLNGLLVVDDASCNIPGTVFWKGHQSVSDACNSIDATKFANVLNVGHNRVFRRIA
ncbi:MAG: class I SAM-dependent methyltransferase [Cyclobacteriaceae bacterium]|nr:class I SAM-dependent methyltransferase [Cyclobacteriaceae bacterium]